MAIERKSPARSLWVRQILSTKDESDNLSSKLKIMVLETAARIFFWPACSLHYTVHGNKRGNKQFSHVDSPSALLVNKRNDTITQRLYLFQPEFHLRTIFPEETLALAQHHRIDQQAILLDEVILHKQIGQIAPAVD